MKKILIKDYANGSIAVSYELGKKCKNDIIAGLKENEKVELDFLGIEYLITAFLNPVIGDLIIDMGKEIMQRIEIKNANMDALQKIKCIKDGALLKREDEEE